LRGSFANMCATPAGFYASTQRQKELPFGTKTW
jgi:hypothetical protein